MINYKVANIWNKMQLALKEDETVKSLKITLNKKSSLKKRDLTVYQN